MDEIHLSRQALTRLEEELAHRSGPFRSEISLRIERARELGDISENGDYDAAKNEQGLNEARVRQLDAMLKRAVIVEAPPAGVVAAGTVVSLIRPGDHEPVEYLVGSIEERSSTHDVLSTDSPMGKAVLGHGPGDVVDYQTPRGKTVSVTVQAVRPAD